MCISHIESPVNRLFARCNTILREMLYFQYSNCFKTVCKLVLRQFGVFSLWSASEGWSAK